MPLPPDLENANPNDPFSSLSDVHYNSPTSFMGNIEDMLQSNSFKVLADKADADPNLPTLQYFNFNHQTDDYIKEYLSRKPASSDEIAAVEKERPGFKAPPGVSKTILDKMAQNWDDKEYYGFVANRPASTFAHVAGFGGMIAGGFMDPSALILGGVGEGAVKNATAPWVKTLMNRLAVSETMGSKVGQVGTLVGQSYLRGAAGLGSYQATQELAEQSRRASFNEPASWIESLQRVGQAAKLGGELGVGAEALGIGLVGYERPIVGVNEAGKLEVKPGATERVGGLFNTDAFSDMAQKTKDLIGRTYRRWSGDADITAREDAMGQALNGQEPNVDIILQQGAIDEGARFRSVMAENHVDMGDLDSRLLQADEETNTKLQELLKAREVLRESDDAFVKSVSKGLEEDHPLTQEKLLERPKSEASSESIPENVKKFLDIQQQIDELKQKEESQPEVASKITRLEKRRPKLETHGEELKGLKKRLLDKGLPEQFEQTRDYKRLVDLAKVTKSANDLLQRIHLERDHQMQIRDLLNRKVDIHSMRDHINGTHRPVTQDEVKQYAKHLDSIGVPDIEYDLPDDLDTSYDKELNQFSEEEMRQILEEAPLDEIKAEVEETIRRRENQPQFKQMVKDLITCIIRNEAA